MEELKKQEADAARIAEAEALAKAAAEKERLAQEASDEADRIAAEKVEACVENEPERREQTQEHGASDI